MSSTGAARAAMEASSANGGAPAPGSVQQGLAAVADYIPSQALAVFLGLWGLKTAIKDPTPDLLNGIVVLGFILVAVFVAAGFNFNLRDFWQKYLLLLLFGVVAFYAWVLAMPGGPYAGDVDVLGTKVASEIAGGALVIVLAPLMPVFAKALKLRE